MISKTCLSLVVIGVGLLAKTAVAAEQPALVTAPVEKVFVPLGFDDNDDVEVMVHGHFPNTCYKVGPASSRVDVATGTVTLEVQAYFYRGVGCAQVMVPFVQAIKLGTVAPGTFRVEVLDRPDVEATPLIVGEARTASPDDFLYSPVAAVSLDEAASGQYQLRLEGEYPLMFIGCMVMREVRTYVSPGNTLVVQPIAELVDGPECEGDYSHKFVVTQPVGALSSEEYLLHVRVLDGNSLNRLVDLGR